MVDTDPENITSVIPSAAKSNAVNAGVILKGKSYSKANLMKPCSGVAQSISEIGWNAA